MSDDACQIKVRFKGERRFFFLASGGRVTTKRLHAVLVWDKDKAIAAAKHQLENADEHDVVAVAVMQGKRRIFHDGEDTPPAPSYGPEAGYRYLVGVERGRPVFHIKDTDGTFTRFDHAAYDVCAQESERAGIEGGRMVVHATTCHLVTSGVAFRQTDSTGHVWS